MSTTLKINDGAAVIVSTIRRIKPITEDDRARVAEKYKIDAAGYNIQIEFADKSTKLAKETLDQVRGQGIGLVNIGGDRYVPAANIKIAEPLSKDDLAKMAEKGLTLSQTFRSRVETTAGVLLSSAFPAQITERAAKALETPAAKTAQAAKGQGPKAVNG